VTIIQCYAPTQITEVNKKDEFYQQLNKIIKKVKRYIIVLTGDMNAKIGSNNKGLEQVMGKHGLGDMNENG
jgi:N-methylhydantoinase B/oxoprolinase/acetone carboxylase alpha subunit